MPKVVTGAGLKEFIDTGKHDVIKAGKSSNEAPPLEVKKEAVITDLTPPDPKPEPKPEVKPEDDGLEPEDKDLSEIIRKKIGKKHRAMKEAQEAAADAEIFAKGQYDRARLAEERAAQIERELQELRSKSAPKEPELKEPDKTDPKYIVNGQFDWDKYSSDKAEFISDKKLRDYEARKAQEAKEAREAQVNARYGEQLRTAHEKYPDLESKLEAQKTTLLLPTGVLDFIKRSTVSGELVYYFATHPEEAARISQMAVEDDSPLRSIAEVGEIVGKLKQTQGKSETAKEATPIPLVSAQGGAPPPITPISGSSAGTINTDPSRMPFKELREYEKARNKKR